MSFEEIQVTPWQKVLRFPIESDFTNCRRPVFSSTEEVRSSGILSAGALVKDEMLNALLQYCQMFNLEYSASRQDANIMLFKAHPEEFMIHVNFDAYERIARSSGLYQPGEISFTTQNINPANHNTAAALTCYATCHFRLNTESEVWLKAREHATLFDYYQRVPKGSNIGDVDAPKAAEGLMDDPPAMEWAIIPNDKLANVAMLKVIRKALGDVMRGHYCMEDPMYLTKTPEAREILSGSGRAINDFRRAVTTPPLNS